MISVLNYKKFERGSLLGFFTLRYHGLSIQNCKLMAGSNGGGAWFSFPQLKIEQDDETKYLDILQLTNAEREAVRALILAELQAQGHINGHRDKPNSGNGRHTKGRNRTPEGENLDDYYSQGGDDIPF